MDAKERARSARREKIVNDVLVAANGCLAVVAILLASLMLIQIEVAAWQTGNALDGPSLSETMVTSPAQMWMF